MTRDVWTIDQATARRLVASFGGDTHAAADALTDASPAERERMINLADEPLQIRLEHDRFQSWAASAGHLERDEAGAAWQTCGHAGCTSQPLDEGGLPVKSPLRQWFCSLHASEAAPEDNQQWRPPLGLDPAGGLVDLEAQAIEVAQAARDAERRAAQHAARLAERQAEAAELGPNDDAAYWPQGAGWTS